MYSDDLSFGVQRVDDSEHKTNSKMQAEDLSGKHTYHLNKLLNYYFNCNVMCLSVRDIPISLQSIVTQSDSSGNQIIAKATVRSNIPTHYMHQSL